MPAVLRIGGQRVVIYPNDHGPAHVHVVGADLEAVFVLNCPDGPPELRDSYGFKQGGFSAIIEALTRDLTLLCREWSKVHGTT